MTELWSLDGGGFVLTLAEPEMVRRGEGGGSGDAELPQKLCRMAVTMSGCRR